MLRLVFLIAPVFVCLFWATTLLVDMDKYPAPRRFLAWFLMLTSIIFLSHFFYFAPIPEVYHYFDIPLQCIGIFIFPLFHIYFRLLTVDETFSFRAHAKFLVIPTAVGLAYIISVMMTPVAEYYAWLYPGIQIPGPVRHHFLETSRSVIKIVFPFLLFYTLIANYLLIRKYGAKAEEFYSDFQDRKKRYAGILNISLLGISLVSFVITRIGRERVMSENIYIYVGWSAFAIMLYVIGFLGLKCRPLNPSYERIVPDLKIIECPETPVSLIHGLSEKILFEFEQNKLHLNCELNIMDLAKTLGSNRTYISSVINQRFNQNFSSLVNSYRLTEISRVLADNPGIKAEHLAQNCGFGSVNSMKRTISAQTGMTFSEIRKKTMVAGR